MLQDSNSRTTLNKVQVLKRSFKFFKDYHILRQKTHICEANYNLARAFTQLSMFKEAIPLYNKVIQIHFERLCKWQTCLSEEEFNAKKGYQCDNIWRKAAYNLMIIHKHLGNHEIAKQIIHDYFTF